MSQLDWAHGLSERLLAPELPRRWAHCQGVARQAEYLTPILGDDAELLQAAAILHDVGYAPSLVVSGLHPLDGARYLRHHEHADERLVRLVAHHSCALCEARERGLADELTAEFDYERPELVDALVYADMTTTATGERTTVHDRIADIHARYGPEHLVSRSISAATPELTDAVHRVEERLAAAAA